MLDVFSPNDLFFNLNPQNPANGKLKRIFICTFGFFVVTLHPISKIVTISAHKTDGKSTTFFRNTQEKNIFFYNIV